MQTLRKASTILNGDIDLVQQLAQWVEDEKFSWQLCYRASDDGWRAEDFHRKCDDVAPTVTVVKCKNNIFGGYTDQCWKEPRVPLIIGQPPPPSRGESPPPSRGEPGPPPPTRWGPPPPSRGEPRPPRPTRWGPPLPSRGELRPPPPTRWGPPLPSRRELRSPSPTQCGPPSPSRGELRPPPPTR